MFRILLCAGAAAAASALPSMPAMAQAAALRPDPLDARAAVPPATYASPRPAYRRAGDVPLGAWREVNDQVARIGGWRAYAREAATPVPAASAPPQP